MKHFKDKILELKKIKKELINEEISLNDKKMEEVKSTINLINKKYDPKIRAVNLDISKIEKEQNDYNVIVQIASMFMINSTVKIMRDLIRIYEGKNFVYEKIRYCPDSKRIIIQEDAKVLVYDKRMKFIKDGIDISKLYALQKSGDGIVLDWREESIYKKFICFYSFSDNELKINVKLNRFPYLKQFIDYVISYCIENNCYRGCLTEEQLEDLKIKLIKDNVEYIQKYHEKVRNDEQEEFNKQLNKNIEYRAKQLRKALNRRDKDV